VKAQSQSILDQQLYAQAKTWANQIAQERDDLLELLVEEGKRVGMPDSVWQKVG